MWITSPNLKLSTPTTIGRKYHVYEAFFLVIAVLRTVYPAVPTYQAVVGKSAQIPCNISLPSEVDSISLVLWYKSGISAPIFSVDSRKGPLEESKHFTSDVLGQRGYFDISTQPSVLTINPIQKDDEGDYRCRIDFRYGRTFNSIVTLNVIVPPEEIIIVDETGEQIYGYIGPYNEGSKLVLGCIVKAGKPPPSVTWWKNSVLLDSTFQDNGDGGVRNDYILQKLTREDLMAQLTCQASNTKLITPEVASVIIDMNLNPVEIRIISTHRHFAAGRQFGIECQTTGSRPPAHISWWLGTRKMEAAVETVGDDGNQTLSNLVFTPSSEDNGKYLSCRAENPRLPGKALEHGITLNVYYKPKVSVILGHGQVTERIQTGDDVFLHCQYNSNPEVTRIEWQYQRGTLISNSRAGIFVRNQTLTLKNVRMEQSGTYRCLADNEEGKGESEELELNIKYVPVCKKGQKIAYAVAVNELVKVSCEVNADPDDVTFTWSVNNTEGSQGLLSFDSSGLRSVACYVPRNKNDFGLLTCKGRNTIGEQIEPCIFTLIAVGPPSPPSNCNISNSTNSTIFVECSHGNDGGLQQRFHVEVYILPNKQLVANITKSNAPDFILSSLPSGSRLLLLLYSSNAKGRSGTIALTSHTLEPVKTESSIGKSPRLRPLLGILLGVVAALGMMALFIVVFFRGRRTREQKTADDGYDQNEKCNSMTQDFTISKAVTSSEPDLINIQNNSPIKTFLPVQKRMTKGASARHTDRFFFQPTVTPTDSMHFNPDDQHEFCQPQTSCPETKGWTSLALDYCQDERSGLSYIGNAGWMDLENDVQAKHELLTVSNPSHHCLQVYPVREYRRYTPV